MTSQSFMEEGIAPDDRTRCQNEQLTERTPLLSVSGSFHNPFLSTSFTSRFSIPSGDNVEEDKAVDVDRLLLDLARANSISSAPIPDVDPPLRHAVSNESIPSSDLDDCREQLENSWGPAVAYNSTFIGISAKRFWPMFITIMIGYFIACFDSTFMASSHPAITSYFKSSNSASWFSTVFLISSTAFQPFFGRVSDIIGRKPVYLLALFVFAAATFWCATATGIGTFIAARAICGIGAGGTMSLGLILTGDLVPIEDRGIYQSHINVAFGLGSASGAAFGGFLCETMGWRWAFGIQVPFILFCFIAAIFTTPPDLGPMLVKSSGKSSIVALKEFDTAGSILLLLSVTSLTLGLNLGGNIYPWLHPVVLASAATFVVSSVALGITERAARQPIMPLPLLLNPPVANLVFANFFGGITSNIILFNLPLFFQAVGQQSATDSGLLLAVPNAVGSVAGIMTGCIITWTRRLKPTLAFGAMLYVVGSVMVMFLTGHTAFALTILLISGVPVGQGFVFPNSVMSALAVSQQSDQAVVTTTINLWRNLGVVLGVALSGLVFQNGLNHQLDKRVKGPSATEIIELVRKSVESIKELEMPYKEQVIQAYSVALRITFMCTLITSAILFMILIPLRLPKLTRSSKITAPVVGD